MSDEHDIQPDYTGADAEERLILCAACRRFRELWPNGTPKCQHTLDEAKDISGFDGREWAECRLDAYKAELERNEPRTCEAVLQANIISLASDLAWANIQGGDDAE